MNNSYVIMPLDVETFAKKFLQFHNTLFPYDMLDDSNLLSVIKEFKIAKSYYGAKLFGVFVGKEIIGIFTSIERTLDKTVDCKIDIIGNVEISDFGYAILDFIEKQCSAPEIVVPYNLKNVINALESLGYIPCYRYARLALNLSNFNLDNFKHIIEKLNQIGFEFKPLINVITRIHEVVDLVNITHRDEPTTNVEKVISIEEFEKLLKDRVLISEACYVAIKDEKIIAVTLVVKITEKEASSMFTGVLKSYRGLGLAKAIKALALNKLKELNYLKISTNNSFENKPILAVNKFLGFEIMREYVHYRRKCEKNKA
jgi:GNAT superfamily N-acetyltransferase